MLRVLFPLVLPLQDVPGKGLISSLALMTLLEILASSPDLACATVHRVPIPLSHCSPSVLLCSRSWTVSLESVREAASKYLFCAVCLLFSYEEPPVFHFLKKHGWSEPISSEQLSCMKLWPDQEEVLILRSLLGITKILLYPMTSCREPDRTCGLGSGASGRNPFCLTRPGQKSQVASVRVLRNSLLGRSFSEASPHPGRNPSCMEGPRLGTLPSRPS